MSLPRICEKCGNKFTPNDAGIIYRRRVCDDCLKEVRHENFIKMMTFRSNIKIKTI